ncbi:MAG: hypothetical protein JWO77_1483 [Ilumatobacteraceae bacterium]|nr:hypothetical protein [Ilumatobacteraceae bacterium]
MTVTNGWSRLITVACVAVAIYLPASATAAMYRDTTLRTTDGALIARCGNAFRDDVAPASFCGWAQTNKQNGAAVAWVAFVMLLVGDAWRRARRRRRSVEAQSAPVTG